MCGTPERLVGSLRLDTGPPDLHTKTVGILLISFLPYSQDPEAGSRTFFASKVRLSLDPLRRRRCTSWTSISQIGTCSDTCSMSASPGIHLISVLVYINPGFAEDVGSGPRIKQRPAS